MTFTTRARGALGRCRPPGKSVAAICHHGVMSLMSARRPDPPPTGTTQQWTIAWKDSDDSVVSWTLELDTVLLNSEVFEGYVDGDTVLVIPRERFISAMRTTIIPPDNLPN